MTRETRPDVRRCPPPPRGAAPARGPSAGRGRGRARAVLGALATTLVVLTACSPTSPSSSSGPPASRATATAVARDVGLEVELRQNRADYADRVVQVRVTNRGGEPVLVRTATLETPTTASATTSDPARGRDVPPGRAREYPVALAAPVCEDDGGAARPPRPARPGRAVVTLDLGPGGEAGGTGAPDGSPTAVVTLDAADPQGHLARVQAEDCAAQTLAAAVAVQVTGPEVTGTGTARRAYLLLTVTPVPGGPPVTVERVDGTVLLAPLDGTSWHPAELAAPVEAPVTVRLPFRPARCDAHAVAEDKRGTFLGVHATVGGIAQHVVFVGGGPDLVGAVHDEVAAACGW